MISVLNRFINNPESESRIRELKKDKHAQQFMFVDEFQDTDDSQIESLLRIAQILDYKLFLVGDVKQCIYRFRGAKEKAFDQLGIAENPDKWLEFSLRRNYRTDKYLLDIFDRSFTKWGKLGEELLTYDTGKDTLIGSLKGDDFEISKLVNYLNGFTREVIQRCADISSENAETIFAQLRRDLKKQGKNLTIFIEDFTGFTGIDQELIT